jgi:hypothetical protein
MLLLTEIEEYMITSKLIQSVFQKEKEKEKELKAETKFFVPREKDTLFWCFFIMKNGDIEYEMIQEQNVNMFVTEKKLKIEYVEKMRKQKQIVKQYKFAALAAIENQLANEHKINIQTFLTLCAIEELNVLYASNNKTYFELTFTNNKSVTHVVRRLDNKSTRNSYHANEANNNSNYRFGYEGTCTVNADKYRTTFYNMEDINKPLRCLTSYKVSELLSIFTKLGVETSSSVKMNKKELYEKLSLLF